MEARKMKRSTYQDILDLPEHLTGELIDGELIVTPSGTVGHGFTQASLLGLNSPFQTGHGGPGGWVFVTEPELHIGENVLIPDIGGWRRERCHMDPHKVGITIAPDWICEILSPSTSRVDRIRKMPIYGAWGVSYLWLVDPKIKILEAYKRERDYWILLGTYGDQDKIQVEPFAAVALDMKAWWFPEDLQSAVENQ